MYTTTVLLVLFVLGELAIRAVYYQCKSPHPLAIAHACGQLQHSYLVYRANARVRKIHNQVPPGYGPALFSENGRELLAQFKIEYEDYFSRWVTEVRDIGSKPVVLYVPKGDYREGEYERINRECRRFYGDLAAKYNVDLIDVTDTFMQYPLDAVTLYPRDAHPSRFGNRVVAQEVARYLENHRSYRMFKAFAERPGLFGDLKPDTDDIWFDVDRMPCRVKTNHQGLRMTYDLNFPKTKQRVLCLGDSFTFGTYLPDGDTYPATLARLSRETEEIEVVNAGVGGYTITDEQSLFSERAKYVEPDITILQVLTNDLPGLLYYVKNEFDRKGRVYSPSPLELEFLDRVRQSLTAPQEARLSKPTEPMACRLQMLTKTPDMCR